MVTLILKAVGMFAVYAAIPDAQTVVAKWQARSSAAAQDYAAGVATTDKDPTQLAIAAIPRMRQRVLEAIDSGKVANGLRRVGKSGWQQAVAAKGAANYSSGISAATDKATASYTRLLAFETSLLSSVLAMPANTDTEREARMLAWVRGMRNYTG